MIACQTCGRRQPEVRVDVYWGTAGPRGLCDPCWGAEFWANNPTQPVAVYAAGARYLVNRDGSESEYPTYES